MKAHRKRANAPKPETLSMDWFVEKTLEDFLDKSLQEDPRGCHSTIKEHEEAVKTCVETLKKFSITNPYRFVERWSTREILAGLDAIMGLETEDYKIYSLGAWLWSYLQKGEAGILEPAGYPERSPEVVNSIARQLQLRGVSPPAYLVTTYPLEDILDVINGVDQMIARGLEIKDVPGLITSMVEATTGQSMEEKAMSSRRDLTPAEMAMLRLLARGLNNKEISEELKISDHTVATRLESILSRLGARNRTHAVAIALRRGILDLGEINGESES